MSDGWDGIGYHLGHRSSKSTFGADNYFLRFDFKTKIKVGVVWFVCKLKNESSKGGRSLS